MPSGKTRSRVAMVDALQAVAQVGRHPFGGGGTVAGGEGGYDRRVLRERLGHTPGEARRDVVHDPVNLVADLAHGAGDLAVAEELAEEQVELGVEPDVLGDVALAHPALVIEDV